MSIITKDIMNYKTYLKNKETINIRLRIIKHSIVDKMKNKDIAFIYSMHRNSVSNILSLYHKKAPEELKHKINNNISLTSNDIEKLCKFFEL